MRGIADHEILADLLGDEKTDRSTTEIVDYIARKEQAKAERGTVCGETPVTAAFTPGATHRRGARRCRCCDGPDHAGRSQRIRTGRSSTIDLMVSEISDVTGEKQSATAPSHYSCNRISLLNKGIPVRP